MVGHPPCPPCPLCTPIVTIARREGREKVDRAIVTIEPHSAHGGHNSPLARLMARYAKQGENGDATHPADDPAAATQAKEVPPVAQVQPPSAWPGDELRRSLIHAGRLKRLKSCPVRECPERIKIDEVLCEGHWHALADEVRAEILRLFDGERSKPWFPLHATQSTAFLAFVQEAVETLYGSPAPP